MRGGGKPPNTDAKPPKIEFKFETGQDIAKTVDYTQVFWFPQTILVRLNFAPSSLSENHIEYSSDLRDFTVQGRSKVYRVEDQVYSAIALTPKVNVPAQAGVIALTKKSGIVILPDTPISSFKLVTQTPRREPASELRVNLVVRCKETTEITSPTGVMIELDLLDSQDFKENIIFSRDDIFFVCRSFCDYLVTSSLISVTEEGGVTAWVTIKPYKNLVLANGLCIGEGVLLNETNIDHGVTASAYQGGLLKSLFDQVLFIILVSDYS